MPLREKLVASPHANPLSTSMRIPVSRNLTEEIFESATKIDAEVWENIRQPTDVFMDCRMLAALETSMVSTTRFRYVIYRDEDRQPVAIAVLSTFTIDVGVLAKDGWSRWLLSKLKGVSQTLVDYQILFCGLPVSAGQSSLRFAPGADTAAVLRQLDRTMHRLARRDRASVLVFKEFADDELPFTKPLESLGYLRADSLPTYTLPFTSDRFDDYLKDVGKTSRHSMQRSMRKFAASGIHFVTTTDWETIQRLMTAEVHQFYESILRRSKNQFEQMPLAFFLETARRLPGCCEFIFALQAERVCGFAISLVCGEEYTALYVGYDISMNSRSDLYFNLSIRGIQDAIAHRAQLMRMGQNADEVKRLKFRAIPSRRSLYVRGGGVLMNGVITLFFNQLFPARAIKFDGSLRT